MKVSQTENSQSLLHRRPAEQALYIAGAVISLLGLMDATYLTVEKLAGRAVRCGESAGCSEVLSSAYATLGTLPLAAIGALAYFVTFSLCNLGAFGFRRVRIPVSLTVAAMFLVSLRLLFLQAFVLHAYCRFCLLSAAASTLLVGILLLVNGLQEGPVFSGK